MVTSVCQVRESMNGCALILERVARSTERQVRSTGKLLLSSENTLQHTCGQKAQTTCHHFYRVQQWCFMFNVPSNSRENCTVNDRVFLLNGLVLFLFRSKLLIVSRKKSMFQNWLNFIALTWKIKPLNFYSY